MYYMIIWCSFRKFQLSINKIFSPSRINLLSTTWISLLSFKHFSNLPMLTFKVPVEENQTLEVDVLLSKSEHTGQLAYCNDLTFCLRCRRSGSVKRYWRHGLEVSIFFMYISSPHSYFVPLVSYKSNCELIEAEEAKIMSDIKVNIRKNFRETRIDIRQSNNVDVLESLPCPCKDRRTRPNIWRKEGKVQSGGQLTSP